MATDPRRRTFAVVTPTLNPGIERLDRCIRSVRAQTYGGPIEHLVMDAGSTDGTVERCRELGVAIVSEPDEGQSDALNKGFARVDGEVLTWLNADDELLPEAMAAVDEVLDGHPGAGLIYGDLEILRDGRRTHQLAPEELTLADFRHRVPIGQPGTFFTRAAWDAVGPLDTRLRLAMDLDLWVRFLQHGVDSVHVPKVQAVFELHDGSKTAEPDLTERYREQVQVYAANGQLDLAAEAMQRWIWFRVRHRGAQLVEDGDHPAARRLAREARTQLTLRPARRRWLLRAMALSPRVTIAVARRLAPWDETQPRQRR